MKLCTVRTLQNWLMKSISTRYLFQLFKCCRVKETSENVSNRVISSVRVVLNCPRRDFAQRRNPEEAP